MAKNRSDDSVQQIKNALAAYKGAHPAADVRVRRQSSESVLIRIIDPAFRRKGLAKREEPIWPLIDALPVDVRDEITMLLLVSPEEANGSLLNFEFDDPLPSKS